MHRYNQEQDILSTAYQWLQDGFAVILYTVTHTWGSSPRPPGALMALREDGHIAGSVSGGCIEDDLIERIKTQGIPALPSVIEYGLYGDEARRFGLPCGGTLRLVQEPLHAEHQLATLLAQLRQGHLMVRELDLQQGKVTLYAMEQPTTLYLTPDQQRLICPFGPCYRLLIIGAGQLAHLLAQIALSVDFAVTICDPRESYAEEWQLAETTLVRTMPDDTVIAMQPDSRMAVVALTHDPKLDDLALMEALASPAFYVAALGSQLNNDRRRERLKAFDLSDEQLAQLHGPAGLAIGSKTPAEIAVSIAAQLIAAKNNRLFPLR